MDFERLPTPGSEAYKVRLIEVLRERGPEDPESRKSMLAWKIIREHEAQEPADQETSLDFMRARLAFLHDTSYANESFEATKARLAEWEAKRKDRERTQRIPNRVAEIQLIIDEAEAYEAAELFQKAF